MLGNDAALCFHSHRSLSNSSHICVHPRPPAKVPIKAVSKHVYILLCAFTRLNNVIVLSILIHIYTHSVLCYIWYTNMVYCNKIQMCIPWKHSLTYNRLWLKLRDRMVLVIKWLTVYVSINIADVQNHMLNKEWRAHHLSTYVHTDMEATYFWDYIFPLCHW